MLHRGERMILRIAWVKPWSVHRLRLLSAVSIGSSPHSPSTEHRASSHSVDYALREAARAQLSEEGRQVKVGIYPPARQGHFSRFSPAQTKRSSCPRRLDLTSAQRWASS